jgi:hypothetical protein
MQHPPVEIGEPIVSRDEIREGLQAFAAIFQHRPIRENTGGMMIQHMYAVWIILRKLQPALVIESGVFKGQSTWLIEQACPDANIICFEPQTQKIVYRSGRATYFQSDFLDYGKDLSGQRAFAFFDDHQDAPPRIKHCMWIGIKDLIFDDNYPPGKGDNYSVKKIICGAGFDRRQRISSFQRNSFLSKVVRKTFDFAQYNPFASLNDLPIAPNTDDWRILQKHIDCYIKFPPIIKSEKTKWGEDWDVYPYPTPEPILTAEDYCEELSAYFNERRAYVWPCYMRLKLRDAG